MLGEGQILRIEHRRRADQTLQHGGLQVVHHQALRHTPERGERVLVAGQEELHLLRDSELQVHAPAVAQHHHEEAQAPPGGAHGDGSPLAPVHLGTFTGGEVQPQECFLTARPYEVDVLLDDREAAVEAGLAQALEDLLRAVGMSVEPANDLALERVQLARARRADAGTVVLDFGPLGYRARTQAQRPGGLGDGQLLADQVVADLAVRLIVDHGVAPVVRAAWPSSRDHRRRQRQLEVTQWAIVARWAALESFRQWPAPGRAAPHTRRARAREVDAVRHRDPRRSGAAAASMWRCRNSSGPGRRPR